jgi:hypothetical protein
MMKNGYNPKEYALLMVLDYLNSVNRGIVYDLEDKTDLTQDEKKKVKTQIKQLHKALWENTFFSKGKA